MPNEQSPLPLTVLGDSRDRTLVTVRPTDEKSLSDCAELADMHSTRLTTSGVRGKSA